MLDVVVVDTEVYSHYFVLVAMELPDQNLVVIEKQADLKAFYEKHKDGIWCCYNANYDGFMIKAALECDFARGLKDCSDSLIAGNKQGNLCDLPINTYEICQHRIPLKAQEQRLGMAIKETPVPFDLNRQLSDTEKAQVIEYCKQDVLAAYEVLKTLRKDFKCKLEVCKRLNLSYKYLAYPNNFFLEKLWPTMKWAYGSYQWDKMVNKGKAGVQIKKYTKVLDFLKYSAKYQPEQTGDVWEPMELIEHGLPLEESFVTIDGIWAIRKYYYERTEDKTLVRLQLYDPFFPHTGDEELAPLFVDWVNPQIKAEQILVQLDLIERLEEGTKAELIYVCPQNLVYMVDKSEVDKVFNISGECFDRVGHAAVMSSYDKLYATSRYDVVMVGPDKPFITGSLADEEGAIATAVRERLAHGRLVSESIDSCTELRDFQIHFRVPEGSHLWYQNQKQEGHFFRFYVSTAPDASEVVFIPEGKTKERSLPLKPNYPKLKICNGDIRGVALPEDLNKDWYKEEAQRRVDFYLEKAQN